MTKDEAVKELEEYLRDADKAFSEDEEYIRGWKSALLVALEITTKIDGKPATFDPTETTEFEGTYYCLGCKETVLKTDKYCAHCGRPINWYKGEMV